MAQTTRLPELLNRVLRSAGRRALSLPDDEDLIDQGKLGQDEQIVLDKINETLREAYREHEDFRINGFGTFTTESGEDSYTLEGEGSDNDNAFTRPVDPARIEHLQFDEDKFDEDIDQVPDTVWRENYAGFSTTGRPDVFRVKKVDDQGRPVVQLYPTPESERPIAYEYQMAVPTLKNSDDRIWLPQDLLYWGALSKIREYDGQDPQYAETQYQRQKSILRGEQNQSDIQVGRQTRSPRSRGPELPPEYDRS